MVAVGAVLLGGLLAAAPAQAAVAFRGASCYGESSSNDTDNLVVPKPAGTVNGDFMLATITALDHDAAIAPPSGWATVLSDDPGANGSVTFSKRAGASEPNSYSFFGNDSDIQIASITSYSGVATTNPIAPGPSRGTTGSATWTLPNANATRWGSMRVTAVASQANVSSTFSAGLTQACDFRIASRAVSSAYERTNIGTTANRSVTRSGASSALAHTVVLQPQDYCGTGGLNLSTPTNVVFPPTTLTGYDQTLLAAPVFSVDDQRGTAAGWNLSGTSTTFTSNGNELPTSATRFVGASPITPRAGHCEPPANTVDYPVTLPAGETAPAAVKLFGAQGDSGLGPVDLTLNTQLVLPSSVRAGTYSSTWTFTLATGP